MSEEMSYTTAIMLALLCSSLPAMAWGAVRDGASPVWWNAVTFVIFVGPALVLAALFIDAMTFGWLKPLVIWANT